MAPVSTPQQVIHTWQNNSCATGESYVRLSDGSVWKVYHIGSPDPRGTGDQRGELGNGLHRETT